MACIAKDDGEQAFPRSGPLLARLNLAPAALRERVPDTGATVYAYVISTIANRDGRFVQRGSAPNCQGGALTLCTCKHYLRSFHEAADWPGIWIAGFSGVGAGGGRNALVFLARIADAYPSFRALWESPALSPQAKRAKCASRHRHGDLYRPRGASGDCFQACAYDRPCVGHDHEHTWCGDIDAQGIAGRRAALLIGEVEATFLWDRPAIFAPRRIGHGQRKYRLQDFLLGLVPAN